MLLQIVCETARRLTIANEDSEDALTGPGIVMIDELELHLHPNWQRSIIKSLSATFPNVQFIFTTHSPLILSGVRREYTVLLNNGCVMDNDALPDIYSATADEILEKYNILIHLLLILIPIRMKLIICLMHQNI